MVDAGEQPRPDQAQIRRQEARQRIERARQELLPSGDASLDQCEVFARGGNRVFVQMLNPEIVKDMRERYGDTAVLAQNTREWVKVLDEAKMTALVELVNSVASQVNGRVVEDSITVLDNKGSDGAIRAYLWPYLGVAVREDQISAYPPKGANDMLKQGCRQIGIDEVKVTNIELDPGVYSKNLARTVVFIGQT
jgi:hypothetical protein